MEKPYRSNTVLEKPSEELEEMLSEYITLSTKSDPTEAEEKCLEGILNQAESNDQLAFWIVVADARISEHLGLLEPKHYQDYEEQHEKLITRLSEHSDVHYEVQKEVMARCLATDEAPRRYPSDIENVFTTDTKRFYRTFPVTS
jgi:hypothetical protein